MADQKGGADDGMWTAVLGLAIVVVIVLAIWWAFRDQIVEGLRMLRYGEMWIAAHYTDLEATETSEAFAEPFTFKETMEVLPQITAKDITNAHIPLITKLALKPLAWPIAGLLTLMGLWALLWGPNTQYRKKHTLETLIKEQAQMFPVISPITKVNPQNLPFRAPGEPVPAELPKFSEALGPEEWLAHNVIPMPDGQIERDAAAEAFAKQLGPRWRGAMKLDKHKQILLASFALKSVRMREESDNLLAEAATYWQPKKGFRPPGKFMGKVRKILKTKKICEDAFKLCNQHAFETTALMRALDYARSEGGVLAPAQFLWVKPEDRTLWYPLNNLGRQSFHPEALGAITHYRMEKNTERPIPSPKVDDAVEAIVTYMNSDQRRPVPALDYSGVKDKKAKKKQGIMKPVG